MPDSISDVTFKAMDLSGKRGRDVLGKQKFTQGKNIYDADFEYGSQPLRWESFTNNGAIAGNGGVWVSSNDTNYICAPTGSSVQVILPSNGAVIGTTIGIPPSSNGLASLPRRIIAVPSVASRGDRVYVGTLTGNSVAVIQCSTNTVIANIASTAGNVNGMAYSSTSDKIYVTHPGGFVSIIDPATNTITATITVAAGAYDIGWAASNNTMYVANQTNGNVYPIPCATNVVGSAIACGTNPTSVAYSPTTTSIYVTNNGSANVSVINPSTNLVTATVTVGTNPDGICYEASNTSMYVANTGSTSVSVINSSNVVSTTITTNIQSGVRSIWSSYGSPSAARVFDANNSASFVTRINGTTVDINSIPAATPSIPHLPGEGGVRMRLTAASGDATIRQSRPYHRYQPGKTMFMATAVNFGAANVNQTQRVGYFDDSNGIFFEQNVGATADSLNPSGMAVVVRTDSQAALSVGLPTDLRIPFYAWSDPSGVKNLIDWSRLQMLWLEYAWYGGGALRWGCYLNGEPYILHEIGAGNNNPDLTQANNPITASSVTTLTVGGTPWIANYFVGRFLQYTVSGTLYTARITANTTNQLTFSNPVDASSMAVAPTVGGTYAILQLPGFGRPWARTGNLPVRYEQRNTGASVQNDMIHFGVSVVAEGGVDDQRGFTYSYGVARATPRRAITGAVDRYPVLTIRPRIMGTQEYTQATAACTAGTTTSLTAATAAWTVNQWQGRFVNYVVSGVNYVARITSNTATVLTICDPQLSNAGTTVAMSVAPVAGQNYTIGIIDRGMIMPRRLMLSCDAVAVVELIAGTATNPVVLTGASFAALSALGSANSFAERDVSATAYVSGGEVVMAFTSPAGGSGLQDIDLTNLFPLYTSIRGSVPDTLTLCVTTTGNTNVGAHIIGQEAMS